MAGPMPGERGRGGRRAAPPLRLNWRLYRLSLAPAIAALLIAAFSLSSPQAPIGSGLNPESFEGSHAFASLREMASLAPSRRPGSVGDARLLEYLQGQLRSLGFSSSGGYEVHVAHLSGPTTWGNVAQRLLIGYRAGTATLPPIAIVAPRDAATRGQSAPLSGAAGLLEVAGVLAQSETRHPVYVIFSDGGSGGGSALVSWLQSHLEGRLDAAIVLGDLAGERLRAPLVQTFSSGVGQAPETLSAAVAAALSRQLGVPAGSLSLASQLAHLAFPITVGEQGPLNAIGVPSVTVSLAGERGPATAEAVSQSRLQATGRAVLSAFYALDHAPRLTGRPNTSLRLGGRLLPEWSIALIVLALLLGPAALAADALMRLRRRHEHVRRWMLLGLLCAWPFAVSVVVLKLLAASGVLSAPPNPVSAPALSFGVGSACAVALSLAALTLSWRAWLKLHLGVDARRRGAVVPESGVAGAATLGCGCLLALIVWLIDPYAALLMLPALHIWPLAIFREHRPRSRASLLALVLAPALAPLALLLAFYSISLGLTPLQVLLEGVLMVGGGFIGWGGTLLWSLVLGLIVAMAIATLGASRRSQAPAQAPLPHHAIPLLQRGGGRAQRERVLR